MEILDTLKQLSKKSGNGKGFYWHEEDQYQLTELGWQGLALADSCSVVFCQDPAPAVASGLGPGLSWPSTGPCTEALVL